MKILFVDLQYDYGISARGINHIGIKGFMQSLIDLGHEVIPFFWDDYLHNTEALQPKLLEAAEKTKPDLIFFCLFQEQFKQETLLKLKEKYTTFNWFGDDSWRFDHFTKHYAHCFTYCATTDKFSVPKYQALGQSNIINSQWAVIRTPPPNDLSPNYQFDVSFIGGKNHVRHWFINALKKKGFNVQAFGNGWDNGSVSLERMNEIFLKSKINLNLSNSICFDLRYLLRHPMNIAHTLVCKKNATQIKARHFEINYNGGFQLTDYSAGLEDYYTIGKDLVCYRDLDEAITLIEYYLKNDQERESIKRNGYEVAIKNHTYQHRMEHVLKIISNEK